MWWLGTVRANWEQVFGPRTWTWFRESFPHMPLAIPHVVCRVVTDDGFFVSPDWIDEGQGARLPSEPTLYRGWAVATSQVVAIIIAMTFPCFPPDYDNDDERQGLHDLLRFT